MHEKVGGQTTLIDAALEKVGGQLTPLTPCFRGLWFIMCRRCRCAAAERAKLFKLSFEYVHLYSSLFDFCPVFLYSACNDIFLELFKQDIVELQAAASVGTRHMYSKYSLNTV